MKCKIDCCCFIASKESNFYSLFILATRAISQKYGGHPAHALLMQHFYFSDESSLKVKSIKSSTVLTLSYNLLNP